MTKNAGRRGKEAEAHWSRLSWPEFFEKVKSEGRKGSGRTMQRRLKATKYFEDLFAPKTSCSGFSLEERLRVAGLAPDVVSAQIGDSAGDIDFNIFGGMKAAGCFMRVVHAEKDGLCRALDIIPRSEEVSFQCFEEFVRRLSCLFGSRAHGLGVSGVSRFLSIKRPDQFVCVTSINEKRIGKRKEALKPKDFRPYWDLVKEIHATPWWNSPEPQDPDERRVWNARAAFLDSLCVRDKGIPG